MQAQELLVTEYDHDNFEFFAQAVYRAGGAADGSLFHSSKTGHSGNRPHHFVDFRSHELSRDPYMSLVCGFTAPALRPFRQKQPRKNLIPSAYSPFFDTGNHAFHSRISIF